MSADALSPRTAGPTRVIAVSNQKGGEGKTTTAVNLAASLAASERRVLIIDLDPQGNASSSVGHPQNQVEVGSYDLLLDEASAAELIHETELPTLGVIPASPDLAGAEIELVDVEGRESVLLRALAPLRESGDWDYVFLDCPPSLGIITLNALVCADAVLIPMQARYFSLEGLGALTRTIGLVQEALNPGLEIQGIVFCLFDPRTRLAQQVVGEVQSHFENLVYETTIPINVRLSESPSFGKPALLYDIESKGAQAYLALAREFLAREGGDTTAAQETRA